MNATETPHGSSPPHVYTVGELNQKIKLLLEKQFPFIWISGEISNFKIPVSGHVYFSLKDPSAQIAAVMFRTQARSLKFRPEDGMSIVGLGRISVYEPRGTYQVIFEYMEPKGIGALQIAFEQLKRNLSDEGLFDDAHKRPMPPLPKKVSIVTSPTGAAVRDFIKIAQRRFPNLPLEVVPVTVQGDRSPGDICRAIRMLNRIGSTDIIVLARGGGSIEDLSAFNDEQLARTIHASAVPVVSAVGHETDFTIADFVADLRAPTPSAAAELVIPDKEALKERLALYNQKLYKTLFYSLKIFKNKLFLITSRIVHPQRRLQDLHIRLDDLSMRMVALMRECLARNRERADFRHVRLAQASPARAIGARQDRLLALRGALADRMHHLLQERKALAAGPTGMLEALNPLAILERGYSITRTLPRRTVVRDANTVAVGQPLEIMLGRGALTVHVDEQRKEN